MCKRLQACKAPNTKLLVFYSKKRLAQKICSAFGTSPFSLSSASRNLRHSSTPWPSSSCLLFKDPSHHTWLSFHPHSCMSEQASQTTPKHISKTTASVPRLDAAPTVAPVGDNREVHTTASGGRGQQRSRRVKGASSGFTLVTQWVLFHIGIKLTLKPNDGIVDVKGFSHR